MSTTTTTTTTIPPTKVCLDEFYLPDLVILNEYGQTLIASSFGKALDGSPVIWEQEITSGTAIDLVGGRDFGWITRSDLLVLQGMAEVVRTTYTFYYGGYTRTVRFRHSEPPVISAIPVVATVIEDNTDWYHSLRIKLMVV